MILTIKIKNITDVGSVCVLEKIAGSFLGELSNLDNPPVMTYELTDDGKFNTREVGDEPRQYTDVTPIEPGDPSSPFQRYMNRTQDSYGGGKDIRKEE